MNTGRLAPFTVERLKEALHYDPATGHFTWVKQMGPRGNAGERAGGLHGGYLNIGVHGGYFRAHRLAWLYMTGEWPTHFIDHINGIRDDNRFSNLRAASHTVNAQNERGPRSNNASGYLGVSFHPKTGKWRAVIGTGGRANKKRHSLGLYLTPEEAHAAYVTAKRNLHEGNTL